MIKSNHIIMIWIRWMNELNQCDKSYKYLIWFRSWFESCDLNQAITWFELHSHKWFQKNLFDQDSNHH